MSIAWLVSVIAWDGAVPLIVAVSPVSLPPVLPGHELGELTAVLLVPALAALLRAHVGFRQIEKRGLRATLGRQFLFGSAIAALMLFEGVFGLLHCAGDAPAAAWLSAGGIYFVYLSFIVPALCPPLVFQE